MIKILFFFVEKDSVPRGVAQYEELSSINNLMKKENLPHILNGHTVYIYRELRATPNFKILRTYRYINELVFRRTAPNDIQTDELNQHFTQYGTVLSIELVENDIKVTYDE